MLYYLRFEVAARKIFFCQLRNQVVSCQKLYWKDTWLWRWVKKIRKNRKIIRIYYQYLNEDFTNFHWTVAEGLISVVGRNILPVISPPFLKDHLWWLRNNNNILGKDYRTQPGNPVTGILHQIPLGKRGQRPFWMARLQSWLIQLN